MCNVIIVFASQDSPLQAHSETFKVDFVISTLVLAGEETWGIFDCDVRAFKHTSCNWMTLAPVCGKQTSPMTLWSV